MRNEQEQDEFTFSKVKISKIDTSLELPKRKEQVIEEQKVEATIEPKEEIIQEEKIQETIQEEIKEEKEEKRKERLSLSDTILIKLSDIKNGLLKEKKKEQPKKSIYNTVAINLENIIKKNDSLNINKRLKVLKVTPINKIKKKYSLLPNIVIGNTVRVNVEDKSYGKYVLKLNKIAIKNLNKHLDMRVNETRLGKQNKDLQLDAIHVNKTGYEANQDKLNKFAVDKLYYKLAPRESKKYKLYKFCLVFSVCIFVFTSIVIGNWFRQGYSIKKIEKDLHNSTKIYKVDEGTIVNLPEEANTSQYGSQYWKYLNTPLSSVDFSDLLKENKDTVGWIIVNNTNINYPVVQSTDNDFYLNHAYDKTSNNAGWIYADFRDNFNNFNSNVVIYGHGRKDKIMFGSLTNVLNKNWYTQEENQIIQLSTLKYNTMWQIFSIYTIEAENYYIQTDFETNGEYTKFLNDMVSRSIYNFGINLSTDDKILTLSTCYNDNGIRLVVQAKLVKFQER